MNGTSFKLNAQYFFIRLPAAANRLFGVISDGVLFRCNRERYLQQSTYHDDKVLIAFKVAFEKEELLQIKRNFETMRENMTEWYCDTQLMEQGLLPRVSR